MPIVNMGISHPRRATLPTLRSTRKDMVTSAGRFWWILTYQPWLASWSQTRASTRPLSSAPTTMAAMELTHPYQCRPPTQAWTSTIIAPKSKNNKSSCTISRCKCITTSSRINNLLGTLKPLVLTQAVVSERCNWAHLRLFRASSLC